jgi:hypothetical protein
MWYNQLVNRSLIRVLSHDIYTEKHHIIPRCLGGSDEPNNLVNLTAREHFIAHWLLTKMVSSGKQKYQLWNAFSCMLYRERTGQERYKITGRIFENIKTTGSKIKSEKFKGENNPMYGRRGELSPLFGRKQTAEHIAKLTAARIGKTRSAESREKQSIATKGRKQTTEHIEKRKCVGSKNGRFGYKMTTEEIAHRTAVMQKNKLAKKLAKEN